MSVRKRTWKTRTGEQRERWVVDFTADGSRHLHTFARKKDADAYDAKVSGIPQGIHEQHCIICDRPFVPKRSDVVTCSKACRQRLHRVRGAIKRGDLK